MVTATLFVDTINDFIWSLENNFPYITSSVCYKLSVHVCIRIACAGVFSTLAFQRFLSEWVLSISTIFTLVSATNSKHSPKDKHRQSPSMINFNICRLIIGSIVWNDEISCFYSFYALLFQFYYFSLRHSSQHPPNGRKRNLRR